MLCNKRNIYRQSQSIRSNIHSVPGDLAIKLKSYSYVAVCEFLVASYMLKKLFQDLEMNIKVNFPLFSLLGGSLWKVCCK